MKKLFLFFLVISAGACLRAQQPAPGGASAVPAAASSPVPGLPPGPLLSPIPDNIKWTLTTTIKPQEGASASGQGSATGRPGRKRRRAGVTTIIGERVGKTAHTITVTPNGGKEERWTDGTLAADVGEGATAPVFTAGSMDEIPIPTWISKDNFAGSKTQGEKSCLIFRDRIIPSGLEIVQDMEAEAQGQVQDTEDLKVDAIAVIDSATRWPVEVTEGDTTTTYKFEPLSPDTQLIPATIQAALAEHEKEMLGSVRRAVRP